MEANKFIKEYIRMCTSATCSKCALYGTSSCLDDIRDDSTPEDIELLVNAVEKWSNEHPIKTNAKKLEEVFGHEVIKIIRGYAAGMTDEKVFRDAFMSWLGEEYKEEDKNVDKA